jgi:hypothetical protein
MDLFAVDNDDDNISLAAYSTTIACGGSMG